MYEKKGSFSLLAGRIGVIEGSRRAAQYRKNREYKVCHDAPMELLHSPPAHQKYRSIAGAARGERQVAVGIA